MIITVHVDPSGLRFFVNTDPAAAGAIFQDPAGGAAKLTILQLLAALNANPAFRTQGGWDFVTTMNGQTAPQSMWAHLVAAANAQVTEPALTALALK